jgi:hypothetical protein
MVMQKRSSLPGKRLAGGIEQLGAKEVWKYRGGKARELHRLPQLQEEDTALQAGPLTRA